MSYDFNGLHQFLSQTPEQGLRKMLVDPKGFTEVHFNLLIKTVRACPEPEFVEHAAKETFPKLRFSPAEIKVKDLFWKECIKTCTSRGILSATKAA